MSVARGNMTNIQKLMIPACARAAFPVFSADSGGQVPLNEPALNPKGEDPGRVAWLDSRIFALLPDDEQHTRDVFRSLEWLYACCQNADPLAVDLAADYLARPMPPLADIPTDIAHLLRRVYQARELVRLLQSRDEPQFAQCGLDPVYRKLIFEAKNSFADLGAQFAASVHIGSNTSCLTSAENIQASFRHSLSTALTLASDLRMRIEVQGDSSGLRSLYTFYSGTESVDFEAMRGIPRPGEGDLSIPILYEVIRICGGGLRYANTNGVGELLLDLSPAILLDDNVYSLSEFTPLDESSASPFCLEYADVYNERRPRA